MNIMEPTFILRTLYNFDLELNLNLFISIMDIKKYIFETRGIPIGKQCMILDGQILKSNQTLEQCNIVNGTIIIFAYPTHDDDNLIADYLNH